MIVLSRGWAVRFRMLADGRRQILGVVLPGNIVGAEALLGAYPGYAVQAVTDVIYREYRAETATAACTEEADLSPQLTYLLGREKAASDEQLLRLGCCNSEERIAAIILSLHARLQRRGMARAQHFLMPLTKAHLADMAGLTIVHLRRVLIRLEARRLLTLEHGRVTLHDLGELRRLSPLAPHREEVLIDCPDLLPGEAAAPDSVEEAARPDHARGARPGHGISPVQRPTRRQPSFPVSFSHSDLCFDRL